MVRWRYCLVLAMLLLLLDRIDSKIEEDEDDERRNEANEEDDDDYDEEEDEEQTVAKSEKPLSHKKTPAMLGSASTTTKLIILTRTQKKRPLECYVCTYKSDTPLKSCLDPAKYRVHTITCHSPEDKCFTSVVQKGHAYDSVVRGCQTGCIPSPDSMCCEADRCNSQPLSLPGISPRVFATDKVNKSRQPTVLFFISVLLVLQTVIKVSFI